MKNHVFTMTIVCLIIYSGCSNHYAGKKEITNQVSIKSRILFIENAALARWDNGDPMGFVEVSREDDSYFDLSLKE